MPMKSVHPDRPVETINRRQREILTANLAPRGLSRSIAAAYVGVSPNLFDRMVNDKLMPKPIRIYGRLVWDRFKLDEAFSALPYDDGEPDDIWSLA